MAYPAALDSFTTKADLTDLVSAAHMNAVQTAIVNVETALGTYPHGNDGWAAAGETWTYASATTFTVGADVRTRYPVGTKLKLTQTSAKYFYVVSTSYSAPNTTVTVTGGSDYTIANAAITSPYFSYASNPQDFPHWFAWTPTLTGGSSDLSAYTVARFAVTGRTCHIYFSAENKSMSGSAGATVITLPIASAETRSFALAVYTYPGSGAYVAVRNNISSGNLTIYKTIGSGNWDGTETGVYMYVQGAYSI